MDVSFQEEKTPARRFCCGDTSDIFVVTNRYVCDWFFIIRDENIAGDPYFLKIVDLLKNLADCTAALFKSNNILRPWSREYECTPLTLYMCK